MNMTNAAAAALLIGAVMPFLISVIKQVKFPKWANWLIAAVLCAGAGTLTVWATGGFSHFQTANLLVIMATVFVASQAAYAAYWKGTSTEDKLNTLTSVGTSNSVPNVPETTVEKEPVI